VPIPRLSIISCLVSRSHPEGDGLPKPCLRGRHLGSPSPRREPARSSRCRSHQEKTILGPRSPSQVLHYPILVA
jgi:hypothetical protein